MSTRTHLSPYSVLDSADMSIVQNGTTILKSLSVVSYEISWSGSSPVGAITVQLSNSYKQHPDGSIAVAGHWNDLPLQDSAGVTVPSISVTGNTGSAFVDVRITGGEAIRIVYTPSSGSGSLSAVVAGKVT